MHAVMEKKKQLQKGKKIVLMSFLQEEDIPLHDHLIRVASRYPVKE